MLQSIREKFTGVVALVIIGAIGIALAISFSGSTGSVATGDFAAKVNGDEIPMATYQRVAQDQLYRQQQRLQGGLTPEIQQQVQRNTLESLIMNQVIKQFVRDNGFRVDDEQVMDAIRSQEVFRVGGEFSYDSYVMLLQSRGITPKGYEHERRAEMEIEQLQNGIVTSAFFTPADYRRYISLLAEQRTAAVVRFDPAKLAAGIDVTDEQVQAFYDANSERFMSDESVDLDYIEVLLSDLKDDMDVTEQEISDFYENNADRFVTAEQRKVSHILFLVDDDHDETAAMAAAAEAENKLAAGASFGDVAREMSEDAVSAPEGGELGWATPGDYPEAFEEALAALEPGEVSAPVRTEFGVHLIYLDELRPGEREPLAAVRDQLHDELRAQKATDAFYALAERVDDLALQSGGGLADVAEQTGLPLKTAEGFTHSGNEALGFTPELVDMAFSPALVEDGENSPLLELGDNRAVVIHVAEHHPSALRPLAEVRPEVEEVVRAQAAAELARQRGAEVLARLQAGDSLAELAKEYEFEVPEPQTLTRGAQDYPPDALATIFRAPRPDGEVPAWRGADLAGGGYVVFRLDAVTPGRPDAIPREQRDERKQILAQQAGGNAAAALLSDLRAQAKVVIAPGLFDSADDL